MPVRPRPSCQTCRRILAVVLLIHMAAVRRLAALLTAPSAPTAYIAAYGRSPILTPLVFPCPPSFRPALLPAALIAAGPGPRPPTPRPLLEALEPPVPSPVVPPRPVARLFLGPSAALTVCRRLLGAKGLLEKLTVAIAVHEALVWPLEERALRRLRPRLVVRRPFRQVAPREPRLEVTPIIGDGLRRPLLSASNVRLLAQFLRPCVRLLNTASALRYG